MATQTTHRLGDILISKGLITPIQLNIAINEQKKRRQQLAPHDTTTQIAPLGEILIELGFITRMQLKRGLGWQSVVRKLTLAMSLCAPLLTISYEATAATAVPIVSSSSSSRSGSSLPVTIQAENYSSMSGVYNEPTTDIGGGQDTGNIDANDWMIYSNVPVNIPTTGTYIVSYRVASLNGGGKLILGEAGSSKGYDTVTIDKTGGWQNWTTITRAVTLPAGTHNFKIVGINGGFNLNWFKIESVASSSSAAAAPAVSFAQTIEAENYTSMSGVFNEPTTDVGGGQDTGNINTGDWMSYSGTSVTIPVTGSYKISYRVASLSAGGSFALLESSTGASLDTVTVPVTGGWQTWVTVDRTVTLTAGVHTFNIKALSGGFNVNWFKIANVSSSSSSSSAAALASSSSSAKSVVASSSSSAAVAASSTPVTATSSTPTAVVSSSSIKPVTTSSTPTAVSSSAPATSSSSSSSAPAALLSQTIEAENYTTMSGVFNEPTTDVGGGQDTGNINANDWMSYSGTSVVVPVTGSYKISYRVASLSAGGSFSLLESGGAALDTVTVPVTGDWQNWVTVERTVTLTAGTHTFDIRALSGGFNINWFKIETVAAPLNVMIEAENYSAMRGVYNEPTTDVGGGQDVGNIDATDFLVYAGTAVNVPVTGSYTVTYRVASLNGGGSFSLLEAGGTTPYDTVTVPYTGGWQNWSTIKRTVTLTAGMHYFGITAITGGFNLNWFSIDNSVSSGGSVSSSSSSLASASTVASTTNSLIVSTSSTAPATTSSTTSSAAASSAAPVVTTSSATAIPGLTSLAAGPVSLSWTAPTLRQNGTPLDITEIAGYEIRYKLATDANFTYISINDAWTNSYTFAWLEGLYIFQLAAFDKDGLYSDFVTVAN